MRDIDIAIELLHNENLTLAIVKDEKVIFLSKDKGIKPLYSAITEHKAELEGSSIADRVTGRAAAMICAYGKVKHLKTGLISDNGINILKRTNITYEYDERVPFIENRDRTGMCPIETLSLKSANIEELLSGITKFLESIKKVNP